MLHAKLFDRYSPASMLVGEPDSSGRLFLSEAGQVDLSGVQVLHSGVDTVRQLYEGLPVSDWWETIEAVYSSGFNQILEFDHDQWVVGSGGKSGYRFRLQNNELGLIILFGSRYAEKDKFGAHLKIECSPHWLKDNVVSTAQLWLDGIARKLLNKMKPTGVAVHIAIDVQGWEPPDNFEALLSTRSKRRIVHHGCDSIQLHGLDTVQRYGVKQSFLFGSAASCQFAVYRKDLEALKRDKLDYWRSVWGRVHTDLDEPVFNSDAPVWRLEFRFHHSVIRQVKQPESFLALKYLHIAEQLTSFLHYGLDIFRLDFSSTYADPFWQLLYEDVSISSEVSTFIVQRVYKTPALGSEKNLALAVGNLLSIYARYRYSTKQVIHYLKAAGLWSELCEYWEFSGKDPQQQISKGLALRRLIGKAA